LSVSRLSAYLGQEMYTAPHILVVDDEPLVALLVADWLGELGYHVVGPISKVPEAMRLVEDARLDGALLDVNLGAGDSFTLADAVRAKGIPLAFITGDGADGLPFEFEAIEALSARLFPIGPGMPASPPTA
jgi:CheY-like chemotaxis protein